MPGIVGLPTRSAWRAAAGALLPSDLLKVPERAPSDNANDAAGEKNGPTGVGWCGMNRP